MLIMLTPGGTGRRKEYFLWRIDLGVSPIDSRGNPHRFKRWPPPRVWRDTLLCVVLCSVWGMDSRGGPHRFKRWSPTMCVAWHFARCGT